MQKIMFNDRYGLTGAVIVERKTMTRRVIKPQPDRARHWNPALVKGEPMYYRDERGLCQLIDEKGKALYPAYKVGEIVAVAQSYESIHDEMMSGDYYDGIYDTFRRCRAHDHSGWKNKMYVKAEYMPHRIRITGVRAERLQDITDEECLKEGIYKFTPAFPVDFPVHPTHFVIRDILGDTPREAFASLIDKVSGKGTWERNPWVWAYEFELIE